MKPETKSLRKVRLGEKLATTILLKNIRKISRNDQMGTACKDTIRKRNSNWSWARWRLFRCSNNAQAIITNSKQPSLTHKELFNMALELGADVPVCLHGKTTRMQGIGERLSLLQPLPKLPIVLVNPNCRLETKDVFGAFRGNYSDPIDSYLLEKSWSQEKLKTY